MTEVLLYLHILLFIFSFAFTAGLNILGDRIIKTGDIRTIHTVFAVVGPLSRAGGIGWILTGVAGGALAHAYGYDPMAPWLLASYAVFAILLLNGFLLHLPWQRRVVAASAAPGPGLEAVLHAPMHRVASAISALCLLTLIYLMTARPG